MEDRRRDLAKQLSRMNQQPKVCNGERDGYECVNYWQLTQPTDVENAHHLTKGETTRYCTLVQIGVSPLDLGENGDEQAVDCNRYLPSTRKYRPADTKYNPLSPEEIQELEKQLDANFKKENAASYGAPAFVAADFVNTLGSDDSDGGDDNE